MAMLNLFPPTVSTYADAFLADSNNTNKNICKVYFSISAYNTIAEIRNVQVNICNQNTNTSVLNSEKYPCEIMLTEIKRENDKYYIEIKPEDLINGKFEINQYYKIQLRFTSINATQHSITIPQAIDSWLFENLDQFSEWSTVILARAISSPTLTINNFDNLTDSTILTISNIDISGKLSFKDMQEQEILESYIIKLYNNKDNLIINSDIQYTNKYNNPNEINYTFDYEFIDGEEYYIEIEYKTKNGYKETNTYNFIVLEQGADILDADINVILDKKNGRIGLNILNQKDNLFSGNITIRRSSNESNFTIWEDVFTFSIEGKQLNYTWYDTTIKSGVWYNYGVQKRNSLGIRGILKKIEEPVMIVFDDIFLNADNKQLCVKFNPQIQSFQRTIAENKLDTIGSKYPFIKRNGNMNYKQFPLSGLISFYMDKDNIFYSREDAYGECLSLYDKYNDENWIENYNDSIYEREFREKVIDFLYKDNVKLFRSSTEGNILVKLMDISFTPEQTLGRHLYSFNCTAYEIDECNIKNYDYYNIQTCGKIDDVLSYQKDYIGQYNKTIKPNENVIDTIGKYYNRYSKENYIANVDYLDYLKIEIEDKPYLISENELSGGRTIGDDTEKILGYIAYINNQPIVIKSDGVLELKGENVKITSLSFARQTKALLDYHVYITQKEDIHSILKSEKYYKKVGQEWGAFGYEDSIYKKIWNKYYQKYSDYFQTLVSLDSVTIQATPGAVVYIKEKDEKGFDKFIIDETGLLEINNKNSNIQGIYFAGIHLSEATEEESKRESISSNKFIDTNKIINDLTDEKGLINNGVYILADNYLMVYDQLTGRYILKAKSDNNIDMTNIDKNGIIDNSLIVKPERYLIADNTIIIDPDEIELYEKNANGEYAVSLNTEEDSGIITTDKENMNNYNYEHTTGEYKLVTKSNKDMDIPIIEDNNIEEDSYSMYLKQIKKEDTGYELTIYEDYDKIFALILQQEIDKTNKYIWYNNSWYPFINNNDLVIPVEGLIDYTYELMKGDYNIW